MKYLPAEHFVGTCDACRVRNKFVAEVKSFFKMAGDRPPVICQDCRTRIMQADRKANSLIGIRADMRMTSVPMSVSHLPDSFEALPSQHELEEVEL